MVHDVVTFVRRERRHGKKWLIVGKGPSSDNIGKIDLSKFNVLTLNHACTIARPLIAHFVDIEACCTCLEGIAHTAFMQPHRPLYLCLPWHPHHEFKPSQHTLTHWLSKYKAFDPEKILSYNSALAGRVEKNKTLSTIRLRYFSAVAAFNILVAAGEKVINTIGVDGGRGYGRAFDTSDRLSNGRQSFDAQSLEIERTQRKNKIVWNKL